MSAAPSPARPTAARAASSRPTAARCFSTRSATCRRRRRPGCCACCRRASSPRSAAASRSGPMCASSPPRIATCATRSARASSARICSIASMSCRSACRRCASGPRTLPMLARHFLERAREDGLPAQDAGPGARSTRCGRHRWPGNVRELENLMRRLAALCPDEMIGARHRRPPNWRRPRRAGAAAGRGDGARNAVPRGGAAHQAVPGGAR